MLSYLRKWFSSMPQNLEEGQGLVEYALILVLVAVVVIVTLSLVGSAVQEVYGDVLCTMTYEASAEYGNVASGPGPGAMRTDPDSATSPSCWVWDGGASQYVNVGAP